MDAALILSPSNDVERLIDMTVATCASPHTRRMYKCQLRKFFDSGQPFTREGVALHLQAQRDAGNGSSSLISAVAAIRKLASEAKLRRLITPDDYEEIAAVSPGKQYKTRAGVWLTVAEVRKLLSLPDSTYWGLRDAAILSTMVGCGLRRAEMADLPWTCLQSREGRMCWCDFIGKGSKHRTVPIPAWALSPVEAWRTASREPPPLPDPLEQGRRGTQDPVRVSGGLSADHIHHVVVAYGERLGYHLTPHDLRRTLAQMMRKAGAPIEQIQYTLGHEDIATTVLYLGSKLELAPGVAAVDQIKMGSGRLSEAALDRVTMVLEGERQDMEVDSA